MQLDPTILAAPIAIPLVFAALGLPFVRWGWDRAATWQRRFAVVGVLLNLAVAITLLVYTLQMAIASSCRWATGPRPSASSWSPMA